MYQNIFYSKPEKTYYLRDDSSPTFQKFQYTPTYYERISSYQEGALPVLTGGWAKPTKKFDWNNTNLLERDIDKELVLLRDLYYGEDESIPSYQNIVYLDIENTIGGAITPEFIREAPMDITAIALIDITTKTKTCFIVDKNSQISDSVDGSKTVISCKSEKELFYKFLDKWEELDPTICSSWNGTFFDIPYLYHRGKRIIGNDIDRLSPIRKMVAYTSIAKDKRGKSEEVNIVQIGGVSHLDYMLLFKKYIAKQEPSYKLKDIALKYTKLEKLEYEGNLNQLFKNDPKYFIDYNLRDVEIIEALEEKLKFIELTIMICHICNVSYESIFYATALGEGAILKSLKKEGIVSPNKPTTTNPTLRDIKETYAGGYVKEPKAGIYEYVIDIDFTSLYPSLIKSLNIGIETLVGRIKPNPSSGVLKNYEQNNSLTHLKNRNSKEKIIVERLNTNNYTLEEAEITIKELIEIIEDNNYSIAASGAFFRTDKESVSSKVLRGWFDKREYYRELKKNAGKEKDWDKYKLYDLFQQSFKILQNSHYGIYSITSWRYTDGQKMCSSAITNSGQYLTKSTIEVVNDVIYNKMLKMNKNQLTEYFGI